MINKTILLMWVITMNVAPDIMSIVLNTADRFNLEPALVLGVIKTESSFDRYALVYEANVSDYSIGLMQVRYDTAKGMGFKGSQKDLMQPATNIYYGCRYLKSRIDKYGAELGIASYNSGSPVYKDGKLINQVYLDRVKKYRDEFRAEFKIQENALGITVNKTNSTVALGILLGAFGIFIASKLLKKKGD